MSESTTQHPERRGGVPVAPGSQRSLPSWVFYLFFVTLLNGCFTLTLADVSTGVLGVQIALLLAYSSLAMLTNERREVWVYNLLPIACLVSTTTSASVSGGLESPVLPAFLSIIAAVRFNRETLWKGALGVALASLVLALLVVQSLVLPDIQGIPSWSYPLFVVVNLAVVIVLSSADDGALSRVITERKRYQELQTLWTQNAESRLRSLLTPILSGLSLLPVLSRSHSQRELQNVLEIAERNAYLLKDAIEEVLDISGFGEDSTELCLASHHPRELLLSALRGVELQVIMRRQTTAIDCPEEATWNLDRLSVIQLFVTLLSFVSRTCPNGARIHIQGFEALNRFVFKIDVMASQDDVTQDAAQVGFSDDEWRAFGEDYSVCNHIVEQHGGELESSPKGEGSCSFIVRLPRLSVGSAN